MRWSWRGTRRRCGRTGNGGRWHWFRCFGHDGERQGLLIQVHVFELLIFQGSGEGRALRRGQLQKKRVEFAIYAALLDDFVEDFDGRPAVLCHRDAELAQVCTGVDGQATLALKLGVAHFALQAAACKTAKIVPLETSENQQINLVFFIIQVFIKEQHKKRCMLHQFIKYIHLFLFFTNLFFYLL